jgi:hypothetical protein
MDKTELQQELQDIVTRLNQLNIRRLRLEGAIWALTEQEVKDAEQPRKKVAGEPG